MRVFVQIEFGEDIDGAVEFLEENDLTGRILFEATGGETRKALNEVDAEERGRAH